jgi:hypothetical protein
MPPNSASAVAAGRCSLANEHNKVSTYLQSVTSVIIDWILVLLPIPSVFGTIMDRKTRFSIIAILLLGARYACIFSCFRAYTTLTEDSSGSVASIVRLAYVHTFYTKNPGESTS